MFNRAQECKGPSFEVPPVSNSILPTLWRTTNLRVLMSNKLEKQLFSLATNIPKLRPQTQAVVVRGKCRLTYFSWLFGKKWPNKHAPINLDWIASFLQENCLNKSDRCFTKFRFSQFWIHFDGFTVWEEIKAVVNSAKTWIFVLIEQ